MDRTPAIQSNADEEYAAIHECAHAFVAYLLGGRIIEKMSLLCGEEKGAGFQHRHETGA